MSMQGTSQPAKIGLDARAAELKQKLLKSRSQSQARITSSQQSTDAVTASPSAPAAVTPARTASRGGDSLEQRKLSSAGFFSQKAPQAPVSASLPADANDIADLISSISSAATDVPGPSLNSPSPSVPQKPQAKQTGAAVSPSLPTNPAPVMTIPPPGPARATPQSKQPPQSANKASAPVKTPSADSNRPGNSSPPEEGEIISPVRATLAPAHATAPSPPTAPRNSEILSATASAGRRQPVREDPGSAVTEAPVHNLQRPNSGNTLQTSAQTQVAQTSGSREPEKATNGVVVAGRSAGSGKINGESVPESSRNSKAAPSSDTFTRLLSEVPDLQDWLEMTDYFNPETRTRKLDRFRRAKALAAEKLRIEEEERRLMEEEELEMGLQRSTVARLSSAVPSATTGSENFSLPTPVTAVPLSEVKETANTVPPKRSYEEDGPAARLEKMPRLESPRPTEHGHAAEKAGENGRIEEHNDGRREPQSAKAYAGPPAATRRPSPPRRARSSSPRRSFRRSPPPRSREYSPDRQARPRSQSRARYGHYEDRPHRYDRYYNGESSLYLDSSRRRESGQPVSYPIHIDLGGKGDTRFFILKSFNAENVRACMEDNLWTTQIRNGQILAEAFAKCKNVILFFSINRSRAFQGYARMASAPSPDTPRPRWLKALHWDSSDPFRVQWLSKTPVEFYRIGHLKNPYNENLPVLVGKDGQEIEEKCGTELLREMEAFALEREGHGPRPDRIEPRRDSGGWGYRYHEDRPPIKRETSPGRW